MRFADIIGHNELKRHLAASVDAGRISHAQLFTGIAGSGALPLAVAYVQYIHCQNRHNGDSCGVCPSCHQISALAHPDLHFIYPVNKPKKKSGEIILSTDFLKQWRELFGRTKGYFSQQDWLDTLKLDKNLKGIISTKEMEDMIRKLSFKSFESAYKTVIIWLPETMNEEAANRILKILEEPWEKTVFILVSERPDKLLRTILSRTQEVVVPRLSHTDLESIIREHGESDATKIRNMARIANGDILELQRLLNGAEDDIHQENFNAFCTVMRLSYNDNHLDLMRWADTVCALPQNRQISMLNDFSRLLREAFMIHAGLKDISYLWGEEEVFCRKFSPYIGSDNIEPIISEIEIALKQIGQNSDARIVLNHLALAISKYIKKL